LLEFTLGTLSKSWSVPGGYQLVGQDANLPGGCYMLNIHRSPCIITQPWGWYSFTTPLEYNSGQNKSH